MVTRAGGAEALRDEADAAARITQSGAVELIAAEEALVLDQLVSAYNTGNMQDRDALVGVALLARLRAIKHKLNRAITRGIDAGHKLTRSRHYAE